MTESELRAAAERLVRWADSDPSGIFYDSISEAEAVALARRWLAEHPADDGEPVTAGWIEASGGERHGENGDANGYYVAGNRLYVLCTPGRVEVCPPIGTALVVNPTRGQLRRLCAALGVPLTEGTP